MKHKETLQLLKDFASTTNKDGILHLLKLLELEIEVSILEAKKESIKEFKNKLTEKQ